METKEIINLLLMCADYDVCKCCYVAENDDNYCVAYIEKEAAERLEELDAELEKRTINDRPYEWISMEDERKPKEGESCIVRSSTGCITIRKYEKGGFPDNHRFKYWMHNPALPKPKEPTFRDVFLKAFPKASVCEDGTPKGCVVNIFPWATIHNCALSGCIKCWSRPYFEEEGGEE